MSNYLKLFDNLEQLFYVRTDLSGNIIEYNNVFNEYIQFMGAIPFELYLIADRRNSIKLCIASQNAIVKKTIDQTYIHVKWFDGKTKRIKIQAVLVEQTVIYIGWELNRSRFPKVLLEIAFILSHVIRKPAANIIGLIPLLSKTADNAKIIDYLEQSSSELNSAISTAVDKIKKSR